MNVCDYSFVENLIKIIEEKSNTSFLLYIIVCKKLLTINIVYIMIYIQ
jgi:hypothetical protein